MRLTINFAAGLLLVFIAAGCAGNFGADPRSSAEQRVYAAQADEAADAVQKVMARLQWRIEKVEEPSANQTVILGRYQGYSGARAGSGGGTNVYGVEIRIETVAPELTRIVLNVLDAGGSYGSTRPSEVRRLFFDGLQRERLQMASATPA